MQRPITCSRLHCILRYHVWYATPTHGVIFYVSHLLLGTFLFNALGTTIHEDIVSLYVFI